MLGEGQCLHCGTPGRSASAGGRELGGQRLVGSVLTERQMQSARLVVQHHHSESSVRLPSLLGGCAAADHGGEERMTCDRPVSVEDDHPGVDCVVERTRPDDGRQLIDAQLVRQ